MQTGDVKQGFGLKLLKGLAAAMLVPVLGVPATKLAESYFNVSFFSSQFEAAGVWAVNWLGQTIPVQLWLFWVVVTASALVWAFGIWSFLDKRFEVGIAKAEQEKAYAKAREAIEQLKAGSKKLEAAEVELKSTRKRLKATDSELNAASAKIADLETPKERPLTEHQRIALACIAYYHNADEQCYARDLIQRINFTVLQAEGALDVLLKRKLVEEYYTGGSRVVSLSPDGRAYVLQPDFDMSYLPL